MIIISREINPYNIWTIKCNGCGKHIIKNESYNNVEIHSHILILCESCKDELKEKL